MSQLEDSAIPFDHASTASASGFGARMVRRLVSGLRHGRLRVVLPSGAVIDKTGDHDGPEAAIVIRRWRTLRRVVAAGDIGFAEAYMDGDWTTPDLTAVIQLAARNSDALEPAIMGSLAMRMVNRVRHILRPNSRNGSRKNIEAHYDLGNDFYKQWLDPSMLYSSAIWADHTPDLESAQQHRLDRIREGLELKGGETVLEIGCGWGALAEHLAVEADAKVTGITLSPSQLAWAKEVAHRSGKGELIDLRIQDYRDVEGQFDRIVSIEMFEAVGEAYWPSYFNTIRERLKRGGTALLQIISIEEKRYQSYRKNADFIQKYVFPGGFLPSDSALAAEIRRAGLALSKVEHFGRSYARTLAEWRNRFRAAWPSIAPLGFDQRFQRLWDYYLSYCEAGFAEGSINVGFYTLKHADG